MKRLSPNVSFHQIVQEIEFIAAIKDGLQKIDKGKGASIEAVEQMFERWISN